MTTKQQQHSDDKTVKQYNDKAVTTVKSSCMESFSRLAINQMGRRADKYQSKKSKAKNK